MLEQHRHHTTRLQEQNRLLSECLADERRLRKEAYAWYQKRLQSRFWGVMDMMLMSLKHKHKITLLPQTPPEQEVEHVLTLKGTRG